MIKDVDLIIERLLLSKDIKISRVSKRFNK